MKCKYSFEKMELDGEIVAVPIGDNAGDLHAVLYVNEEAMRIIELLQDNTTIDRIVEQLQQEYAGDKEQIKAFVSSYIDDLRKEGLIEG